MKPTMGRLAFVCLAGLAAIAAADDFPAPFNAGAGSDGLPLDPQKAAEGFQLPPGFKCNVFAAEPDVQNPVAMTWDNRGRRSEERRVGKECRSRWSRDDEREKE